MRYKYLTPAEKILTQKYLKEDLSMHKSIDTIVPFPVKSKGTPKAVTIPGIFITPLQFKNNTLKPAIPNQENLMKKLKTEMNKRSIWKQPKEIKNCQKISDFEIDTVVSYQVGSKNCLITIVDRKSRYIHAKRLPNRQSQTIKNYFINDLKDIKIHSLTSDSGTEFYQFKKIEEKLGISYYFANPYCSWQRATNENANGLIGQFFSKENWLC